MDEVIDDFEKGEEGGDGSYEEGVKEEIEELKGFVGRKMALETMESWMRAHRL